MSDLIYRSDAIEAIASHDVTDGNTVCFTGKMVIGYINDLPSIQPPWNPDEWCHDCKEYDKEKHCCPRWNRVIRNAMEEAKPRKGKWIEHDDYLGDVIYECSVCKEPFVLIDGTPAENLYNFCPNCGADMRAGLLGTHFGVCSMDELKPDDYSADAERKE